MSIGIHTTPDTPYTPPITPSLPAPLPRPEPRFRNQNLQVDADSLCDLRQCTCVLVSLKKAKGHEECPTVFLGDSATITLKAFIGYLLQRSSTPGFSRPYSLSQGNRQEPTAIPQRAFCVDSSVYVALCKQKGSGQDMFWPVAITTMKY